MNDEIEVVSDADGLAVVGSPNAVDRFLSSMGLRDIAVALHIDKLGRALETGSDLAYAAAELVEKSGRYVKLTKESAARLKAEGLIDTKTPGVSYAMFGQPGEVGGWVQVERTAGALLTNPAMLAGAAGMMAQFARQAEAQELKDLLSRIDGKLDDVRRRQRDEVLARLDRAIEAVDEAIAIREHGGDTGTAWEKVVVESGTIAQTRADALRAVEALADKVDGFSSVAKLAKSVTEVEKETALWLSVLARTFLLDNEYKILEIDRVMEVVPDKLEYHRRALDETLSNRQRIVFEKTEHLLTRMEKAGELARANVILHAGAANRIIDSANNIGEAVQEFRKPMGLDAFHVDQLVTRWMDAIRNPEQLRTAAADVGPKIGMVALSVAGAALTIVAAAAVAAAQEESGGASASE
jgi:hypothetical protein